MALSDFLSSEILKKLADASIEKGNVYRIEMDESNGITPKHSGDTSRHKYFIVLGFDNAGNVYGGVIMNSEINKFMPPAIVQLQIPVQRVRYPFLMHESYVNCAEIKEVNISKFSEWKYLGKIERIDFDIICEAVRKSPVVTKANLQRFGL